GCAQTRSVAMEIDRSRRGLRTGTLGRRVISLACVSVCLLACMASAPSWGGPPQKPIDFAHDIVPVFKARCAECHTRAKSRGSFSLDTREAMLKSEAVAPGKSGESELIERVTSDAPDYRMPQKGPRLPPDEVGRLKAWIDQGAPWEKGLSFKRSAYAAP